MAAATGSADASVTVASLRAGVAYDAERALRIVAGRDPPTLCMQTALLRLPGRVRSARIPAVPAAADGGAAATEEPGLLPESELAVLRSYVAVGRQRGVAVPDTYQLLMRRISPPRAERRPAAGATAPTPE